MDSMDDRIARLLRLKRYEQPPPGYFENFLHEFRLRQREREVLLREPLWQTWFERVRDFAFRPDVRPWVSAGAAAVFACAAVISLTIYRQPDTTQLAVQASAVPIRPPIMDKQLEFEPASFDMQATLLPGSTDLLVLPASDERVPFNLEWESTDDQSLVEK
jgi:hypothetical protein